MAEEKKFDKQCKKSKYVHWRKERKVMSEKLGRRLTSNEEVHHLDHDWSNNNLSNLKLFESQSKHRTYHEFLKNLVRNLVDGLNPPERFKKQQHEWYIKNRTRILFKRMLNRLYIRMEGY